MERLTTPGAGLPGNTEEGRERDQTTNEFSIRVTEFGGGGARQAEELRQRKGEPESSWRRLAGS